LAQVKANSAQACAYLFRSLPSNSASRARPGRSPATRARAPGGLLVTAGSVAAVVAARGRGFVPRGPRARGRLFPGALPGYPLSVPTTPLTTVGAGLRIDQQRPDPEVRFTTRARLPSQGNYHIREIDISARDDQGRGGRRPVGRATASYAVEGRRSPGPGRAEARSVCCQPERHGRPLPSNWPYGHGWNDREWRPDRPRAS
jgi:hypothetical protein